MAILSKKENKKENVKTSEISAKPVSGKGSESSVDAYRILIKPLVTEKSYKMNSLGKYAFKVNTRANKISVSKAIEKVYGVKVDKVNIVSMKGKPKNFGKISSKTSNWKKAVVTLKKGEVIQGMEA